MTQPLTDARLLEIETAYLAADTPRQCIHALNAIPELLAEVRRLSPGRASPN